MASLRNFIFGTSDSNDSVNATAASNNNEKPLPLSEEACKEKLLDIIEIICRLEITDDAIDRFSMSTNSSAATRAALRPDEVIHLTDITQQNDLVSRCKFLIDKLVQTNPEAINTRVNDGTTLLHWAVNRNSLAIVEYLLSAGAHPIILNSSGFTALHTAIMLNRHECFSLLVWKGLHQPKTAEQPSGLRYLLPLIISYIDFILRNNFDITLARILISVNPNLKTSRELDLYLIQRYFDAQLYNPTSFISLLPHDMARNYFPGYLSSPIPILRPRVTIDELMAAIKSSYHFKYSDGIETIDRYFRESGRHFINERFIPNGRGELVTPLHYAIKFENTACIEKFLGEGFNIEEKSSTYSANTPGTPLAHALEIYESKAQSAAEYSERICHNILTIIRLLVDAGANLCDPSVLMCFWHTNRKMGANKIPQTYSNIFKEKINALDESGNTVLTKFMMTHSQIELKHFRTTRDISVFSDGILRRLIHLGADLYTPVNGVPPLLSAFLMFPNASVDLKGLTYLLSPEVIDSTSTAHINIINMAWINLFRELKNQCGYNSVYAELIKKLLLAGANVNYQHDGETALSLCLTRSDYGIIDIIEILLASSDIDLNITLYLHNMSLLEYVNSIDYLKQNSIANKLTISRMINDAVAEQALPSHDVECLKNIKNERANPQSYLSLLPKNTFEDVLYPMLFSNKRTVVAAASDDYKENPRKR